MSQITRCPFCSTAFKVVADQLRISDGWVRCGQCKEVFDASEHLLPAERPAPLLPDMPLGESPAMPPEEPPAPDRHDEWPTSISALLERESPPPDGYELPGAHWDEAQDDEMPDDPPELPVPEPEEELAESDAPEAEPPELPDDDADDESSDADEEPDALDEPEPGFVTAARRDAYWRRPAVRAALVGAGLVLAVVLGLQVAVQERDVLAARSPAARAVLQGLCATLGCTLQAPQRIAAVVIDGSSFVKARGDASGYQLQVSIKNTAALTVAMPALELTLTDAQEQAVLRRVLSPEELAAPPDLAAGAVWNGTVSVQVAATVAPQVAGYRLLAFYP